MKKIAIFCLVISLMLFVGCKGDTSKDTQSNGTDSENSKIEITPGISDSIFDENGNVVDGVPTISVPEIDQDDDKTEQKPDENKKPNDYTFEDYMAMTSKEKEAHMKSFAKVEDFFDWYEKAKKEYDDKHPPIDVGDGNIDLDKIFGEN